MAKKMTIEVATGIVSETYAAEVNGTTDREVIKSKIVEAQQAIRRVQDVEADDAQLNAAKDIVKDLGKGYREAKKNYEAQIVVALTRLEELGAV